MLKHYKPATQGKAGKELQNKGKCFYFGENFTCKLHTIPGDAKSKIPKLSLHMLMVFCSQVYFLITEFYCFVLWLPKVGKAIYNTNACVPKHTSGDADTYLNTYIHSHTTHTHWAYKRKAVALLSWRKKKSTVYSFGSNIRTVSKSGRKIQSLALSTVFVVSDKQYVVKEDVNHNIPPSY